MAVVGNRIQQPDSSTTQSTDQILHHQMHHFGQAPPRIDHGQDTFLDPRGSRTSTAVVHPFPWHPPNGSRPRADTPKQPRHKPPTGATSVRRRSVHGLPATEPRSTTGTAKSTPRRADTTFARSATPRRGNISARNPRAKSSSQRLATRRPSSEASTTSTHHNGCLDCFGCIYLLTMATLTVCIGGIVIVCGGGSAGAFPTPGTISRQ